MTLQAEAQSNTDDESPDVPSNLIRICNWNPGPGQAHENAILPAALAVLLHLYTGRNAIELEIEFGGSGAHLTLHFSSDPSLAELVVQAKFGLGQSSAIGESAETGQTIFAIPREVKNELASSFACANSLEEPGQTPVRLILDEIRHTVMLADSGNALEPAVLDRVAAHLRTVIAQATNGLSVRVSEMELVEADERSRILEDWNKLGRGYEPLAIPELFAAQAQKTPHATALRQGDQRVTFAELNSQVNQVARYLRRLGVGRDIRVGFCFGNSIRGIVALLGILKAGGVYVPLDPQHPPMRLREIIHDAGLSLIVKDDSLDDRVLSATVTPFDLGALAEQIAMESADDFESGCTPDDAAYVVYTSGSTGRPVGVIGIHRSVTNGLTETLFDRSGQDEVCCLNGPLSVGFNILGLFLPLMSGIPLVVMNAEQYKDPLVLAGLIESERITTIVLPTPALRQLMTMGHRVATRLRSLKVVMVGGSQVTPDLVADFVATLPCCELRKGYGSSEIGGIATRGLATAGNSVGRSISNTRVYILNKYLRLCPTGVVGELYVSAGHLARGYLNRPELTSARFMPDLITPGCHGRMYKTGDFGRYSPDGEIEFLGRVDDVVKIRGFRVQLAEIEASLAAQSGVAEAVVSAREIERKTQLVAYVVPKPQSTLRVADLREYLSERIPEYMVPSVYVLLDRLPVTAGGKVDRQALPDPGRKRPDIESEYVSPRNEVEEFLADAWKELLQLDSVGIHDHFIDLGGDSVFTVQVASRIWERFGLELPSALLFEHPTLAELAQQILSSSGVGPADR